MGFCKKIVVGLLGFGFALVVTAFGAVAIGVLAVFCVASFASVLAYYAACLCAYPFVAPVYLIVVLCLPEKKASDSTTTAPVMEGKYRQSRNKEALVDRIKSGSLRLLARASTAVLVALVLSVSSPGLKRVSLLGSPLWKWCLLGSTFIAGYFEAMSLSMLLVVWKKEKSSYYFLSSLFLSMNHVAYFGMILVSWLVYFRTEHGLKQASTPRPQAFQYVTWTLVSLFAGSILWLFKTFLLAKWSAGAIHRRFEPRILITSVKYFFIGLVAAGFSEERIIDELDVLHVHGDKVLDPHPDPEKNSTAVLTKYIMSRKMELTYLDYVSSSLMSLAEIVSPLLDRDDEDGINPVVVDWFEAKIKDTTKCTTQGLQLTLLHSGPEVADDLPPSSRAVPQPQPKAKSHPFSSKGSLMQRLTDLFCIPKCIWRTLKRWLWLPNIRILLNPSTEEFRSEKSNISQEDRQIKNRRMENVLYGIVREGFSSADAFSVDDLKIWMVDAHKDCINMGRTLVDAKAMVTRLDVFLSSVIIVLVLLLWILITGIASTKLLVTIATPFLALTFIFGDTAKTFFQGLIFCFGTHAFDVGDRCILDQIEMEVKTVSILTTTFMQIGSKERRFYPNSELATKAIVNLGCQPDPSDVVELTLDSSTDLKIFEEKIHEYLNKKTHYKKDYKLKIKEIGNDIKVTVHFTHVLTVKDLSHNQCFVKKSEQRSNFLKVIKNYIHESRMESVKISDEKKTQMANPDPSQSAHLT